MIVQLGSEIARINLSIGKREHSARKFKGETSEYYFEMAQIEKEIVAVYRNHLEKWKSETA